MLPAVRQCEPIPACIAVCDVQVPVQGEHHHLVVVDDFSRILAEHPLTPRIGLYCQETVPPRFDHDETPSGVSFHALPEPNQRRRSLRLYAGWAEQYDGGGGTP